MRIKFLDFPKSDITRHTVLTMLGFLMLVGGCSTSSRGHYEYGTFNIRGGQTVRVFRASDLDRSCKFLPLPAGQVIKHPVNGKVVYRVINVAPAYKPNNPRYHCNRLRGLGGAFFYTPKDGFKGNDSATIRQTFRDGSVVTMDFRVTVK